MSAAGGQEVTVPRGVPTLRPPLPRRTPPASVSPPRGEVWVAGPGHAAVACGITPTRPGGGPCSAASGAAQALCPWRTVAGGGGHGAAGLSQVPAPCCQRPAASPGAGPGTARPRRELGGRPLCGRGAGVRCCPRGPRVITGKGGAAPGGESSCPFRCGAEPPSPADRHHPASLFPRPPSWPPKLLLKIID